MELMILAVINVVFALVFVRGAVRSAFGFFRLVLSALALVGTAAGAVAVQNATGEDLSPVVAIAVISVSALALTLAIATVKFLTVAVAAAASVMHGRQAQTFLAEALKAEATSTWSSFPAWCRKEAAKHEAAELAASRWLYSE